MPDDQKLDLKTLNISEDKVKKLKEIFPEVVTEGKIDYEKLKLTLGEKIEAGKERYGMNWPGKADCFKTIQAPGIATLKPARNESVDFDNTENLFIEGDNLEVLRLLQKSYFNKVKMIYIDPPYNTGNDFVYPDDYSESLDTYLRYTGQKNGDGKHFSTNVETNGRFHSKWMNMMYPRLFLARNLLKDDGVIFISIDDHEVDNLKKICNEIFGEENFITQFVWKRRASSALADYNVSTDHEYVICFQKGGFKSFTGSTKDYAAYKNLDDDPKGSWTLGDLTVGMTKDQRPNQYYNLIDPRTGNVYPANHNRVWAYIKESMDKLIKEGKVFFPDDTTKRPMLKRYKQNLKTEVNPISTLINGDKTDFRAGLTSEGTKIIQDLFNAKLIDYPKPVSLIKSFVKQVTSNYDIVLDFFAGSGTTAHAILELNKEDGGNRKFIMVQLPEPTDENSEAFKAGYKNIAQIGEERIRRVIKKIKEEKDGELDLEDKKLNLGFKVFKLDQSNFKIWDGTKKDNLTEQLKAFVNHINPNSSQDDILYELILKSGFPLSAKIEVLDFAGKKVYSVEDTALYICLEKEITKELLKEIADKKPVSIICLDEGFQNNDQLKTNALEIMKIKGVKFRTV